MTTFYLAEASGRLWRGICFYLLELWRGGENDGDYREYKSGS